MLISRGKKSVFYTYLVSYFLIYAIPLLVLGAVLYYNSVIAFQKEICDYNLEKLYRIKDIIDKKYYELKGEVTRIELNSYLSPTFIYRNDYWAKNAVDELFKDKSGNIIIDNIFLYYKNDSFVLSASGRTSLENLTTKVLNLNKTERQKLTALLNNINSPRIMRFDNKGNESTSNGRYTLYLFPIPSGSVNSIGIAAFKVNDAAIEALIGDMFGDSCGRLYIINEKGQTVFTMGDSKYLPSYDPVKLTDLSRNRHINKINIDGTELLVLNELSPTTKWSYIAVSPSAMMFSRVHNMRMQVERIVLLVVLAGVAISFMLSMRNYQPIKKITDMVTQKEWKTSCKNELEGIQTSIHYIIEKNKVLLDQLDYQQPFMKEHVLSILLKGILSSKSEIIRLAARYRLDFSMGGYYVAVVEAKNCPASEDEKFNDSIFKLKTVIDNHITSEKLYSLELLNGGIILIACGCDEKYGNDNIRELMEKIGRQASETLGLSLNIGVGAMYSDVTGIKNSFIEALSALEYSSSKTAGDVIFFSENMPSENLVCWYPINEQLKLTQCLKQGNVYVFRDIVNEIMDRMEKEKLTQGMSRAICFGIINTIISFVNEINANEFKKDIEQLTQFASLEELHRKLEKTVYAICGYVNSKKERNNEMLKNAIIDYVNNNYSDCMLSLETVASMFNITPKYLSRFFKQQTGCKFMDYIRNLRINYAKKLLAETDKIIKDIVVEIGYSDAANFIRTFRQLVGVTPGQYRELRILQ